MNDFFEQLAFQSALKITGSKGSVENRAFRERKENPSDIEVVDVTAVSDDDPANTPSHPSAEQDISVVSIDGNPERERPPEPGHRVLADNHPVQPERGAPEERIEHIGDSPPDSGPPMAKVPSNDSGEADPAHLALDAVLRWIAKGEPHRSGSDDGTEARESTGEERHRTPPLPESGVDASSNPGTAGAPIRDGDAGKAETAPDGEMTPRPATREPAPPPRATASIPHRADADERPFGKKEPDVARAPSVTIGSIQVTVDAGQPPAAPPPRPAPAPANAPRSRNAGTTYLRRHYIVPH